MKTKERCNNLTVNQGVSGSSPEGGAKELQRNLRLFLVMYYLYILYSASSDKYYIGQSEDPWNRLIHHNTGDKDTYTSKHRPWSIVAVYEAGHSRADALKMERFIKKQKSRILIERILGNDFVPDGILAQLVRVPHVRD